MTYSLVEKRTSVSQVNVFNGEELPLRSGPLRVGRYPRSGDPQTPSIEMVFEILRKIQ